MKQPIQQESGTKSRPDGPTSLTQERSPFPTLCGPGCSCGKPVKTGKWKIVIMLIVIVAALIALGYKEMM